MIGPTKVVPGTGIEPVRPYSELRILSPLRLPISPPGRRTERDYERQTPRKRALLRAPLLRWRSVPGVWRRDPESNRAERICNRSCVAQSPAKINTIRKCDRGFDDQAYASLAETRFV